MRSRLRRRAGNRSTRYWVSIGVVVFGLGIVFVAARGSAQTKGGGSAQGTGQTAAQAQEPANAAAQGQEQAGAAPQLKVTSNLVVVRAVVTDASGRFVGGLHEGDFKIFDRGKEQSIVQFDVESPTPVDKSIVAGRSAEPDSVAASSAASGEVNGAPASPTPSKNFVALYFDTLSTTPKDLAVVRGAAQRYLLSSLKPNDRAAIFTSDKLLADFTDDQKQLGEAVGKVYGSVRARTAELDCPHLSDYQALQLTEFSEEPHADVWILARDEMAQCKVPVGAAQAQVSNTSPGGNWGGSGTKENANAAFDRDLDVAQILNLARTIVQQNQILVRDNLQQIDRLVQRMAQLPGRRNIVLVSPGFMTQTEQLQLDRVIDHALRSQVVINSLDPKGLAILLRSGDSSLGYSPSNGDAMRASRTVDSNREFVVTSVLAEVAEGTGGKYVHNNNDLQAGFAALERSGAYILAFAPTELKADGGYHALKVSLAGEGKGLSIQARRGYFAPKGDAPVGTSATAAASGDDPAERAQHDQIQQQVLSKVDVAQLPVELRNSVAEQPDHTQVVTASAHLDTRALQFQQEGDRNINGITFVVAVFDGKDKLVEAQQRHMNINALDAQLPNLFTRGLDVAFTFKLATGTYRLRAVVADSVQHLVGAKSESVTVP
jgi:VWFA-related protein